MICASRPPSVSSLVLEGTGLFICLFALAGSFLLLLGGMFGNLPTGEELPVLVVALGLSVLGWLPRVRSIRILALVMTFLCVYVLASDLSYYQGQGLLRDFYFRCLWSFRN